MSAAKERRDEAQDAPDFLSKNPTLAKLIQDVPQESRAEVLRALVAIRLEVQQVEQFSGPIPHPSIVERYELTLPGSADRILTMAEELQAANIEIRKQYNHNRHSHEVAMVKGLLWNERAGMFLVVGLALAIVLIGMRIIELGHSAEGFAVIVAAACGIGIAYMKSLSQSRDQDSEQSSD